MQPRTTTQAAVRVCKRCHSTTTQTTSAPPRLRFAPSPTGYLHLGGLRTALFNHIVARQGKGKWILRIEDTDQARVVPGATDSIRRYLDWAGLNYDEGLGVGGSHGPYVQSERLDLYQQHARELLEADKAYECFCSADDLEAMRVAMRKSGSHSIYDGRCRHLSSEDRKTKRARGIKSVIRFKDPGTPPNMPEDLVFGEVKAHSDSGTQSTDDFVLLKSDGFPTYHLASVVDDYHMQISHVLRGEEWLPSLPKHVNLYHAFGWKMPRFAHLPLIMRPDGRKLSKRYGDPTIADYKKMGYEPEALLNYLATLGWDPSRTLLESLPPGAPVPAEARSDGNSHYEAFTLSQLIDLFKIEDITRRKAIANADKLNFLNRVALRRKAGRLGIKGDFVEFGRTVSAGDVEQDRDEILARFQAKLKKRHATRDSPLVDNLEYLARVFDVELPRAIVLDDTVNAAHIYMFKEISYDTPAALEFLAKIPPESYIQNIETALEVLPALLLHTWDQSQLTSEFGKDLATAVIRDNNLRKRSQIMLPLRHALTGERDGPMVPEIMTVLGREWVEARLRAGLAFVRARAATAQSEA